nr:VOC family protein [Streptomyces sp. Ru72]
MSSIKQVQVTFDCAEPERVARFWCEVSGYVVPPPDQTNSSPSIGPMPGRDRRETAVSVNGHASISTSPGR